MAEGQSLNNTNNINYLLQDYSTSIEYFDKRLSIAKECNDHTGQRRAHENLGNSYLYLEDFDKALHHYREALTIAEVLNDGVFIAQINFIIGRVYNIKQEYETSIYYHEKHLNLARQFQDSKGQCQAYFILSQLYERTNQTDKAKKYLSLYKALAREINESNEVKSGTKNNILKTLRAESISINLSDAQMPQSPRSNSVVTSNLTDEKSITNKKMKLNFMQHLTKKSPITIRKQPSTTNSDELVDIVCRMQKSRFDDQRCDIKLTNHQQTDRNAPHGQRPSSQLEDIFNTVDRLQQFRLDDQRTAFPTSNNHNNARTQRLASLNDQFLDQLAKSQTSRMDDQRAVLLPLPNTNTPSTKRPMSASSVFTTPTPSQTKNFSNESSSKTLPNEDFFSLLNRLQSRQTDQQRTCISSTINSPSKQTRIKS